MTKGSLAEKGKFKKEIHTALYKSKNICDLILGNTNGKSQKDIQKEFKERVKSHLFIDDTITETETYIFYDVFFPSLHRNIKECRVVMYAITHRDILDNYIKDGYYGDRVDILTQMIEETLIGDEDIANSFGIGKLCLDSVSIYNSKKFYGSILEFTVPDFR